METILVKTKKGKVLLREVLVGVSLFEKIISQNKEKISSYKILSCIYGTETSFQALRKKCPSAPNFSNKFNTYLEFISAIKAEMKRQLDLAQKKGLRLRYRSGFYCAVYRAGRIGGGFWARDRDQELSGVIDLFYIEDFLRRIIYSGIFTVYK